MRNFVKRWVDWSGTFVALVCVFLFVLGFPSVAETPRDPSAQARTFNHILVDVRNSRGGFGDVASGLLTARDFLSRLAHPGPISVMVDDDSRQLLETMLGVSVRPGGSALEGRLQFYSVDTPPAAARPVDLYLHMARPNSTITFANQIGERIPANNRTVVMNLPVLGNTENSNYEDPFGSARIGGTQYELQSPGLRGNESGVYYDVGAAEYAALDDKAARNRLVQELGSLPEANPARTTITDIIRGNRLAGARFALAYGTRRPEQMRSFISYIQGLANRPPTESFVFIHPLDMTIEQVPESLRSRVVILNRGDPLPRMAEPGKIYVYNSGPLSQPIFNGLLRTSEIPPLIAGDGATSAALTMRRSYVMTEVRWNRANVRAVEEHLNEITQSRFQNLLREIYGTTPPNLARAIELNNPPFDQAFRELTVRAGFLTDTILNSATYLRVFADGEIRNLADLAPVRDQRLRMNFTRILALRGDPQAVRAWNRYLKEKPNELDRLHKLKRYSRAQRILDNVLRLGVRGPRGGALVLSPEQTRMIGEALWRLEAWNEFDGAVAARLISSGEADYLMRNILAAPALQRSSSPIVISALAARLHEFPLLHLVDFLNDMTAGSGAEQWRPHVLRLLPRLFEGARAQPHLREGLLGILAQLPRSAESDDVLREFFRMIPTEQRLSLMGSLSTRSTLRMGNLVGEFLTPEQTAAFLADGRTLGALTSSPDIGRALIQAMDTISNEQFLRLLPRITSIARERLRTRRPEAPDQDPVEHLYAAIFDELRGNEAERKMSARARLSIALVEIRRGASSYAEEKVLNSLRIGKVLEESPELGSVLGRTFRRVGETSESSFFGFYTPERGSAFARTFFGLDQPEVERQIRDFVRQGVLSPRPEGRDPAVHALQFFFATRELDLAVPAPLADLMAAELLKGRVSISLQNAREIFATSPTLFQAYVEKLALSNSAPSEFLVEYLSSGRPLTPEIQKRAIGVAQRDRSLAGLRVLNFLWDSEVPRETLYMAAESFVDGNSYPISRGVFAHFPPEEGPEVVRFLERFYPGLRDGAKKSLLSQQFIWADSVRFLPAELHQRLLSAVLQDVERHSSKSFALAEQLLRMDLLGASDWRLITELFRRGAEPHPALFDVLRRHRPWPTELWQLLPNYFRRVQGPTVETAYFSFSKAITAHGQLSPEQTRILADVVATAPEGVFIPRELSEAVKDLMPARKNPKQRTGMAAACIKAFARLKRATGF